MRFQKDNELDYVCETSAKNGSHVTQLFVDISKFLYLKFKDQLENPNDGGSYIAGQSEHSGSILSHNAFRKGSIHSEATGNF